MTDYEITPFNFEKATGKEIESWYQLRLERLRETFPDDPEPGIDNLLSRVTALKSTQDALLWAAWNCNGEMIAFCSTHVSKAGYHRNRATFGIIVRRPHRRRGIATSLLYRVLEAAEHFGRSKLCAYQSEKCPAAEYFLKRTGAEKVSSTGWNQLKLSEVDGDLISEWLKLPSSRTQSIGIQMCEDKFPEEYLQEICDFYQTVFDFQSKKDAVEDSDLNITPESIRRGNVWALRGGRKRLLLCAWDIQSKKLIGLTEIGWDPSMPGILSQGYTAVLPEYRGNGIGRRLKAQMIRRIKDTIPGAGIIRTGNDRRRKAMLRINTELGFRHYLTNHAWEVDVETLRSYLNSLQ